jgi:hypothetical protein
MAKKREEAVSKLKTLVDKLGEKGKDVLRVSGAVVKVVKEIKEAEASKAEASQEMVEVMNRCEGVHGLNKQAAKVLVKFSKMNDAKKSDYLRTLLPGLEAMLPGQLDLFADTAPPPEEVEEDAENAGLPENAAPAGAPLQ